MSKKKFTETLDSLFGESSKDSLSLDSPLLAETDSKRSGKSRQKSKANLSSSGKSFTDHLDYLFEEALIETRQEDFQPKSPKGTKPSGPSKRRTKKPVSGLDSLIRQTIETTELEVNYEIKKRVTLIFDKQKLEKLKEIAKREQAYLKDLVNDLVEQYIDSYESKKGKI